MRPELAADEAYRAEVDGVRGSGPPLGHAVTEPWYASAVTSGAAAHCALADAAASLQVWSMMTGEGMKGVRAAPPLAPSLALAAVV